MNKKILEAMGFGEEAKLIERGICPFCKKEVNPNDFRNKLSEREFKVTGLCQSCQDEFDRMTLKLEEG